MIITKPVVKRINEKVSELVQEQNVTVERLVKDIKVTLLKGAIAKGVPVDLAEDVAAKLIVLIALVDPIQVR